MKKAGAFKVSTFVSIVTSVLDKFKQDFFLLMKYNKNENKRCYRSSRANVGWLYLESTISAGQNLPHPPPQWARLKYIPLGFFHFLAQEICFFNAHLCSLFRVRPFYWKKTEKMIKFSFGCKRPQSMPKMTWFISIKYKGI